MKYYISSFNAGWRPREKTSGNFIDLNLETQELQIKTGSDTEGDMIHIQLYGGSNDLEMGEIKIMLGASPKYHIKHCVEGAEGETFDKTPTTGSEKTWRITEKADNSELYIYCNDEKVLTYVYADRNSDSVCSAFAVADIARFKFLGTDTATDIYRVIGL